MTDNKNSQVAEADALANSIYMQIMANRERLLTAFIAETGLKPSECELVVGEEVKDGNVFLVTSVRRKQPSILLANPNGMVNKVIN